MYTAGLINARVNADPSMVFSPQLYASGIKSMLIFLRYFQALNTLKAEAIFFKKVTSRWSNELMNFTTAGTDSQRKASAPLAPE
jgi:hypothetical protein